MTPINLTTHKIRGVKRWSARLDNLTAGELLKLQQLRTALMTARNRKKLTGIELAEIAGAATHAARSEGYS